MDLRRSRAKGARRARGLPYLMEVKSAIRLVIAATVPLVAGCEPSGNGGPTAPEYVVAVPSGSIGDRVWIDANGNGKREVGEAGAVGWSVTLTGPGGAVSTRTTGADGAYSFTLLTAGSYRVCVTPRPGYTPTWDADGVATPNCAVVNLTYAQPRTDVDFGYWQVPGRIGGRLWNDRNGDALQGTAEAGLGAWVVRISGISLPAGYASTQSADATGRFQFTGLPTGTYKVCVDARAGWTPSYDLDGTGTPWCATAALAVGQVRSDFDFGFWQPSSIGDRVWNDANGNGRQDAGEAGLSGWTVTLSGPSIPSGYAKTRVTGTNGAYLFASLPTGNYTVCVTRPTGWTQTWDADGLTSANCVSFTLPPGTARGDVDFGYRH